mgnify:CR=1 FL=1
MGLVELSIRVCTPQNKLVPQARAWVDLEPDGDLYSEIELPLHRDGEWRWVGVMGFVEARAECFFYRLGIVADPGADEVADGGCGQPGVLAVGGGEGAADLVAQGRQPGLLGQHVPAIFPARLTQVQGQLAEARYPQFTHVGSLLPKSWRDQG